MLPGQPNGIFVRRRTKPKVLDKKVQERDPAPWCWELLREVLGKDVAEEG